MKIFLFDSGGIPKRSLVAHYDFDIRNLLKYSEQLNNAAWTRSNTTVSSNVTLAPDGLLTADKIIETAGSADHTFFQTVTTQADQTIHLSVYLKAGERDVVYLGFFSAAYAAEVAGARFDLTNGVVDSTTAGTASITSVGDGWYRCAVYGTNTTTSSICYVIPQIGDTANYEGDGSSGFYAWGVQVHAGALLLSYQRTTDNQTLIDSTVNGYHGTFGSSSGTDSTDPVIDGVELDFDTSDDYVSIPVGADVLALVNHTIIMVIKPQNTSGSIYSQSVSTSNYMQLRYLTDGRVFTRYVGGGQDVLIESSTGQVPVGAYRFVAIRRNGVNLNQIVGNFADQASSSSFASGALTAATNIRLNTPAIAIHSPSGASWSYLMHYTRYLTDGEISKTYKALKGKLAGRGISI